MEEVWVRRRTDPAQRRHAIGSGFGERQRSSPHRFGHQRHSGDCPRDRSDETRGNQQFCSRFPGHPTQHPIDPLKTDESRLKQLVNEFNQLQKKINEEQKIASDYALAPMPKVEFAEGLCTAKLF